MTPVRMLRNFRFSPDGLRVENWPEGSLQHVTDEALDILIGEGACEIEEAKAHAGAPENKAMPKKRGRPRKVVE